MTHQEAIDKINLEYCALFSARGLMPLVRQLLEAVRDNNVTAIEVLYAELNAFPEHREYVAAISATFPSHEFLEAAQERRELVAASLGDTPEGRIAGMLSLALSPQWVQDTGEAKARELGLMPEATGYLVDGTPLVRMEDIALQHGLSEAQARDRIEQSIAEGKAAGLPMDGIVTDSLLIHRIQ